jgi:hypothetical protein
MDRFGADISKKIEDFKLKSIEPWKVDNSCGKESGTYSIVCDEQKIGGEISNPGEDFKLNLVTLISQSELHEMFNFHFFK